MDTELSPLLAERFDAIERRLDRIEYELRAAGRDGGKPCGRPGGCHRDERCPRCHDRCDHGGRGGRCPRCGCPGCCGRCGRCEHCRCRASGGPARFCGDGTLQALGEAQAVLAAFERARADQTGRGLEEVRESLRVLSRRVSALERCLCARDSLC